MRAVYAIIKKNLVSFARDKARIFMTLIMPLFMLFSCSFLMNSSVVDIDSPFNYLIAGVVITIVFQGVFNNSTAVLNDISSGFMREIIVAPVARFYIAVGNILSASILATLQGGLLLIIGILLGFRTTFPDFILMLVLMMLSAIILSAIVLFLSLTAKNQTNYQIISSVVIMPAMFLSGAYIPITIMPKVILPIVYLNPLTYLTSAFRYVALNMFDLSATELIHQGIAIHFGSITILPYVSWIFAFGIGMVFLILCIKKFEKINLLEVQGSTRGRRR
ncbi:MAG: ABC transporter permease [Eubacteriales bacterium]|nr:ABC transporter permease [Eubacteriales bacterium]